MSDSSSDSSSSDDADPVIEFYKKDVDRSLLRRNLTLTPTERLEQLMELQRFADELQRAGRKARETAGARDPQAK